MSKINVIILIIIISAMSYGLFLNNAYAGASIELTTGATTWDITEGDTVILRPGSAAVLSATSPSTWTVTGSPDGTEDIYAEVTSDGTWTGSTDATAGVNEFVLTRKHASDADAYIPTDAVGDGVAIKTGLGLNGTYTFGMSFLAPAAGSDSGTQNLTVTLLATGWQ